MAVNDDFLAGFELARELAKRDYDLSVASQGLMYYKDEAMFNMTNPKRFSSYGSRGFYESEPDIVDAYVMDIHGVTYHVQRQNSPNILVRQ